MDAKEKILQKLLGLALIIFTLVALANGWFYDPDINGTDATFALVSLPVGCILLFSKEKVINF